jgi:hypothetical protein
MPSGGGSDYVDFYNINRGSLLGKEYVFENEFLTMSFDPYTTWFTVTDKITGEVWRSNPDDAASDPIAGPISRGIMQSLLVINYSTIDGNTTLLNSFDFSVETGSEDGRYNYEILKDENGRDNGFAVHFTIGNVERVFYIPEAVPEWRMEEITATMTDSEINRLRNMYYRVYDIDRLGSTDNREELLEIYHDLEETKVYVLSPTLQVHLKAQAEELFMSHGYTKEDYYNDLQFYESDSATTRPVFNVSVYVRLDGYGFEVTVPYDEIEYISEFPPIEIQVLPFFGAGNIEDEGYMLVPDGSGALINFNNGKYNQNPYYNNVYGWDEAIYRDAILLDPKAHLPVFGIEKNNSAFICVIEEGAAYASLRASVSNHPDSGRYNNVFAEYSLIHRENMEISNKSDRNVVIFQRRLPEGEKIVQRYMFAERSGYMGMAERYREYLMEQHPHLEKQDESAVPVAVEIIGAIEKNQHILGLPVARPFKLTSYNEMADMVVDLNARGFGEVNYRLTGWFNKSVLHEVPTSVNLISRLGSRRDFESLINTVNQNNSNIFLEADFMFMRNNTLFNGFNINRDASRFLNRKRVEIYPYSFIWYGEFTRDWVDRLSHIARPEYMMGLIDGYMEKIAGFGAENVAFRTIGNNLAGDYNEKRFVSREATMNMQVEKLRELHAAGHGIMIQSGYAYAAPYADFITDFPLSWQGYGILDEEIPFYQIVLHGLVPYAGRPMNLAEDFELNILRSLESGAGLYFAFMHESPEVLQTSRFLTYYANQYSMWINTAERIHKEFSEQVGDIYNQYITNYTILSSDVSVTEYENGVRVVVNKSSAPFTYEGRTIEAKGYLVIRGGKVR